MNTLLSPESPLRPLAETLGWTLLHSLWQGAVAAACLAVLLTALRGRPAAWRHVVSLLTLLVFGVVVGVTFARMHGVTRHPAGQLVPAMTTVQPQIEQVIANPAAPTAFQANPGTSGLPGTSAIRAISTTPVWHERLTGCAPWLAALWVAGVGLLSLRHVGGWWRVQSLRAGGTAVQSALENTLNTLCVRYGLRAGAVRLLETTAAGVPMLTGLFRPVVLLPAQAVTGLSAAQLEAILAHELAHLVRRDPWTNLALVTLETLFFYHPAVWWISRQTRTEREHAADDLTLRVWLDRRVYAGALARLAEFQQPLPAFALAATGDGSLLHRIRRIVQPGTAAPAAWSPALPLALCLTTLGLLWAAQGQNEQTPVTPGSKPAVQPTAAPAEKQPQTDTRPQWKIALQQRSIADAQDLDNKVQAMRKEQGRQAALVAKTPDADPQGQPSAESISKPIQGKIAAKALEAQRKADNEEIVQVRAGAADAASKAPVILLAQAAPAPSPTPVPPAATPKPEAAAESTEVEVQLPIWQRARVLQTAGDWTQVHFTGQSGEWNEWVAKDRVRNLTASASASPSVPPITAQDVEDVRVARLLAINRQAARDREAQDLKIYTPEQLAEIEKLYQVANTKGKHDLAARESLKQLLEKYHRANRCGCATLYYGQGSQGAERVEYLTRAVEEYSDCYYLNGCQVGGYGRVVLADTLWANGEKDKARALVQEMKTTYKDATDHNGRPISETAAKMEAYFNAHP